MQLSDKKIAAILVGGKGTRLQPLISHVPKPLAPVGKEPFLFLLIRDLVRVGYDNIVLLTGYKHAAIVAACQQVALGAQIVYSQERQALGTAGAIKQAQAYLSAYSEFLLINGDTYLDDFTTLAQAPLAEALGLIGVIQPEKNDRYGSIVFDDKTQHILNFQEKNQAERCYVNAGIYKFSSAILNFIPENQFCSLEEAVLPNLIQENAVIKAIPLYGQFYDIGLPESYLSFVESRGEGIKIG